MKDGGKEYLKKKLHLFQRQLVPLFEYIPFGNSPSLHGFTPQPIQKVRKMKAHLIKQDVPLCQCVQMLVYYACKYSG
jgi:hypothetical protein